MTEHEFLVKAYETIQRNTTQCPISRQGYLVLHQSKKEQMGDFFMSSSYLSCSNITWRTDDLRRASSDKQVPCYLFGCRLVFTEDIEEDEIVFAYREGI